VTTRAFPDLLVEGATPARQVSDSAAGLARARTRTIRARLTNIPARLSTTARVYTLNLPANSRRGTKFLTTFNAAKAPPAPA
jgi:hypothetical protein